MITPNFIVLPKASIRPDSLIFYNEFHRTSKLSPTPEILKPPANKKTVSKTTAEKPKMPKTNSHSFEISHKAYKRIKQKVTWLYSLSKNKTVQTAKGKTIYSFRMNFVTLTLPSVQIHDTPSIIKNCLNQFLIECSQQFDMLNYVWRLEYQKNGNAHFHIATDVFLPYVQCRDIWNRCIEKLGYVTAYHNKNKGQTFAQYLAKNPITETNTFEVLRKRYVYGVRTAWSKPNTADVRMVTNSANISFYIAKYITKKDKEPLSPLVKAREKTETNMRLWFCSRSLSKVDKISVFMDALPDKIVRTLSQLEHKKQVFVEHCEMWFFDIKKQNMAFKRMFREVLYDYARSVGYFQRLENRLATCFNTV